MAWKQVELRSRTRGHSPGWLEYPAMSVGKNSVAINLKAVEAYGLKAGDFVSFYTDKERGKVGIKCINGMEDQERFGYKLRIGQKRDVQQGKRKKGTLTTGCSAVPKAFPDCVGRAFRLQLNTGERIIEADMSPDNRLGVKL